MNDQAVRIDGKLVAQKVREEVKAQAALLTAAGRQPTLALVLVGEDPASAGYVASKEKACAACGIAGIRHDLPAETTEAELLALVQTLNADETVTGILVQLPLPAQIDAKRVLRAIDPAKDADGLHPLNLGLLTAGEPTLTPCTPTGILRMLAEYGIDPAGKRCVVVGRSTLVGRPMELLLTREGGTVTLCHRQTENLAELTRQADILVVAAGCPGLITGEMIKPGCAVVDVGMNYTPAGLRGDVDVETVAPKAAYLTPVPGGVGPMTIAMLMYNAVAAARRQQTKGDC